MNARSFWALALITGSFASLAAGCLFGPVDIPAGQVLRILGSLAGLGHHDSQDSLALVVLQVRLSRVCLAWLVGAALAVAGAVFQGILQNPLADPFTIGVSTGAAFGASLALFLGLAGLPLGFGAGMLPLAGLAGAAAALAVVLALGRAVGGLRRDAIILAGIVTATFLSACISLLKSLDESSVAGIVFWIMGSFQGRGWEHGLFALPYLAAGFLITARFSREIDLLSLGDHQARLLGVDVDKARLWLLVAASLLTGASVAICGVIGFVGLVAPHMVRLCIGAEHRPLLFFSALAGGLALLWSDVAARSLLPGGEELPVGVITALVGGPVFCLLLRRRTGEDGL